MKIRKIAVIGLGSIGTRHFMNVLELGIKAIGYDSDVEKREDILTTAAEVYSDKLFSIRTTLEDALQECDAVIISTPHKYHFETLKQCVIAGKHCMVEKPLAVSLDGLDEVLAQAKEKGVKIAMGFNMRFRPVVKKTREIMRELGSIHWSRLICASYLPDWRKHQDYRQNYTADPITGGVIFDVSHEIDLAFHFFGEGEVVAAFAESSSVLDISSEDIANITIKHHCGTISNIHLDYITQPKQRRIECAGVNGLLLVDLQTHSLKLLNIEGQLILDETYSPETNNFEYREELRCFIDAIEAGRKPDCNSYDGMKNLELILQAKSFSQ